MLRMDDIVVLKLLELNKKLLSSSEQTAVVILQEGLALTVLEGSLGITSIDSEAFVAYPSKQVFVLTPIDS